MPLIHEKTYDRNELLRALSMALDLSERQPLNHATRTAYASLQIARKMGLPENDVEDIYIAAFLHDIGATSPACDLATGETIWLDCANTGKELMSMMPFTSRAGDYVHYHHRTLTDLGEECAGGIPVGAQIIQLADRLERRFDRTVFYYDQREGLLEWVEKHRGTCFVPEVVDAFLEISSQERFWLDFTSTGIELVLREIQPSLTAQLAEGEVEQIANVFAKIIDGKSTFTYNHSHGVAAIAERLAPLMMDSKQEVFQLKIAALLHDLGKLAVPKEVLEKPKRLTDREFEQIKSHSYYTKVILSRVRGFEVIKEWAGNHHEMIDGTGYPEHRKDLSKPERLMAVADIFQALTENRPYRLPMSIEQALQVMQKMADQNKLCQECFSLIKLVL